MSAEENETRIKACIDYSEPSEELIEWAKVNINEDPDKVDQILSEFKDLIFAKGECTPHRTDDAFLLRFLRARYFIIKRAHRLMVNYYDFKDSNLQYFKNVKMDRMRELARKHIISVPPYKDQLGRRIMIQRLGIWNPSEHSVDELFQLTIGILEIAIIEQSFQIKGGIIIFDFSELSVSQAWHMTPTIANHIVQIAGTSFPMRVEALHIIYQSWIFETGFNLIKPLLHDYMKKRIHFHGNDLESLHAHIDHNYLPKRYGGTHMDYPIDIWFEDCINHDDRVIETLREVGYQDVAKLKDER